MKTPPPHRGLTAAGAKGMRGRYDSPDLVAAWRETGAFPRIHDDIFALIERSVGNGTVLDLMSSTGLLGRRVSTLGLPACAVEGNIQSIASGVYADIPPIPVLPMVISGKTLPRLAEWVDIHQVKTVVARRCLSELWEGDLISDVAALFAKHGVRQMFIEGRARTSRATHPLATVDEEIAGCERGGWKLIERYRECASLIPGNQ